ncbi:hypothetical protein HETIRDRAFT_452184 [Heterobasidion irregulare TC 32-1]|uniref:Secreted protein n=1 Tax=Heterobasidion irregulare (strain TC 32-1) TaxID=747525 RepID=W4K5I3_HETIT|nr:uncharacterized protein HETIRDRAFT_452184 [Heterobasidion irregulare TC 32-1]ETW80625.1 hypothetical protein HETIRDRAFT_452184 [Heterobasidion irregulare TC 32-1]
MCALRRHPRVRLAAVRVCAAVAVWVQMQMQMQAADVGVCVWVSDGKARETGAGPLAPLTYTHRSCIIMAVEVVGDMTLMERAVSAVEAPETPQVLKKRQTCASTVRSGRRPRYRSSPLPNPLRHRPFTHPTARSGRSGPALRLPDDIHERQTGLEWHSLSPDVREVYENLAPESW